MASAIGWLDQSEEHQRKMREIIDLFSETDSRDEPGIAVVPESLSALLFQNLRTIQTRARSQGYVIAFSGQNSNMCGDY